MRKISLLIIALVSILGNSCVKDRLHPAAPVFTQPSASSLMFYWDFNNQDSSAAGRAPTYGVNAGGIFKYYCSYIDYTNGSAINLQLGNDTGYSLRVRNPSDSVIFYMPTTGYDSVTLAFAEEASSTTSGPTINAISYTTDGIHYITSALGSNYSYKIGTSFQLYQFSFVSGPNVNNNPKFAIKIVPTNNNTGTSGNDRIDNLSLSGVKQ